MIEKKPIQHRMTRRAAAHDYTRPGLYHITVNVADGLGQVLGSIVGSLSAPDGSADAPHTALSPVGLMVEHELLTAIHAHYPMVAILDYVVMPDHLHFLVAVEDRIISKNGTVRALGDVITGFKVGCNRQYWEIMQRTDPAATLSSAASAASVASGAASAASVAGGSIASAASGAASAAGGSIASAASGAASAAGGSIASAASGAASVAGGSIASAASGAASAAGGSIASAASGAASVASGAASAAGGSIASAASGAASVAGGSIASAASGAASAASGAASVAGGSIAGTHSPLFAPGYCDVMPIDAAQLATQRAYIKGNPRSRLLRMSHRALLTVKRGSIATALTPSALRGYLLRECPPHLATPEALAAIEGRLLLAGGFIVCDTLGDRALLTARRCLPVVCHRKDAARYDEQKQRCLTEASHGAVLVSACISPREREIITECVDHGFPVITIHDNGFPDRYHPSTDRLDQCMAGRLLLVSPWQYHYRGKNEQVTVLFCKAMNCVAQALCHTKDNWWKNKE